MDNTVSNTQLPPGETAGLLVFVVIFWVFWLAMYFVPTIIAAVRKHRQLGPIAAVNALLGWTVVGWIASFIWSLMSPQQPQTIIVHTTAAPPPTPPPTPTWSA